ncbi:MAG: hypothetical protein K2J74_04870 [Muribaculaceae bacterium]|nr:hypothetical protein [Muribaculaceae bacterium]
MQHNGDHDPDYLRENEDESVYETSIMTGKFFHVNRDGDTALPIQKPLQRR